MVKHTQTIWRPHQTNCFSVFDPFVELVLKRLTYLLERTIAGRKGAIRRERNNGKLGSMSRQKLLP